jgi:hypothetical protein
MLWLEAIGLSSTTVIRGLFWYDFVMSQNVHAKYLVTFTLPKLDESNDESDEEDYEILAYQEEDAKDIFDVDIADLSGRK